MEIHEEELTDTKTSRAIRRAFKRMLETTENEPDLILEGEDEPVDEENTFKEIRSWLFGRREADGYTENSTDK